MSKQNQNQQTNQTIELTVAKLLISTKHLLESLTQWAKKAVKDEYVSDAYVKLGNDFKITLKSFVNSGIDISDINDIPKSLRSILESTLSETPSQETLDKNLPEIRNIIVLLLQKLKSKQTKIKAVDRDKINKNKKVENNINNLTNKKKINVEKTDANLLLAKLQKNNTLLRRASRRLSIYQNSNINSNSILLKTLEKNKQNLDNDITSRHDRNDNYDTGTIFLYLNFNDTTKKVIVKFPLTLTMIRLLFIKFFSCSGESSLYPIIYIQDPQTRIMYELEESLIQSDLKSGSFLSLKDSKKTSNQISDLNVKFDDFSKNMESLISSLQSTIKKVFISFDLFKPQFNVSTSSESTINNVNTYKMNKLIKIQKSLILLKQKQKEKKTLLEEMVNVLLLEIKKLQGLDFESLKFSNRKYMETCYFKLSEKSDLLLTKVDDLQDIMEMLRKDVAQRGVKICDDILKNTHDEIIKVRTLSQERKNYINTEKKNWKKIWEVELDKVCEEQQFFNLQDDLTQDLKEDIGKIEETFNLIQQCSLEKKKHKLHKPKNISFLRDIVHGESLQSLKDNVLNEIKLLTPNHEDRVYAILKAEKIREKEKSFLGLNNFQKELSNYLKSNAFKKTDGFINIEKIREKKNKENLKLCYNIT